MISTQVTALRTRLGLEALSGERRALVEARLDDLYESRGGDRAWAEAAEGERPALVEAFEAAARGVVADPETFRRRRLSYATAPAGAGADAGAGAGAGAGAEAAASVEFRSPAYDPLRPAAPAQPWPAAAVGALTYHGIEPRAVGAAVGSVAKINQDRGVVVQPFGGSPRRALYGVFDGHGEHGEQVAEFCTRAVVAALERAVAADAGAAACEAALAAAFREADAALAASAVESTYSGTTAVVVVRLGGTLVCGNAGDSRAVVVRRAGAGFEAAPLSRDHNPDLPDERRRVEAAGGFVSDPPAPGLSARVWLDAKRTRVGLAMSRSLGDGAAKRVGVVSDAEVRRHAVDVARDAALVAASDGVWEFVGSDEAAALVGAQLDQGGPEACADACRALVDLAAQRWRDAEGLYRDDITCVVARLGE